MSRQPTLYNIKLLIPIGFRCPHIPTYPQVMSVGEAVNPLPLAAVQDPGDDEDLGVRVLGFRI